jgi:hypothetical protein
MKTLAYKANRLTWNRKSGGRDDDYDYDDDDDYIKSFYRNLEQIFVLLFTVPAYGKWQTDC